MIVWCIAFISGVAGLAYEVLWYREFALLLGNTAHAAALVLAATFGGLALGNALAGKATQKTGKPLRAYAALELGMALCAGGVLLVKGWGGGTSLPIFFFFLSLMAVLMGGTLPFLIQSLKGPARTLEKDAPRLYALNTAGAMVGAMLCGFFLPLWLGIRGTFLFLIALNLLLAALTAWIGRRPLPVIPPQEIKAHAAAKARAERPLRFLYLSAWLSGAGTLALEVFWTRMFSLVFQNSVYSFSLILFFVLLALAIGAAAAEKLVRRGRHPLGLVWRSLCLVSLSAPLGAWFFFQVSDLRFLLRGAGPAAYALQIALFTGGIVLPTMIPAGMVLPLCWTMDRRTSATSGWRMGSMLGINTLGAIAGAVGAGFFLMPRIGLWPGIGAIAFAYALGAFSVFRLSPPMEKRSRLMPFVPLAGALSSLLLIWPSLPSQHLKAGETLLSLEHGAEAQVAVVQNADGGRLLKVNNSYNLGNSMAEAEERRMGQIPLLLHPRPRRVAFVGVATGITASAVYDHPVAHASLIELLPEVVRAASFFEKENRGVLKDPQWETRVADGRIVLPQSPHQFDVIISDLFVPWHAGTGALYSLEYYREAASKMADGGLYAQWLPLYQTSYEEFRVIARTFRAVFSHVSIWRGNFSPKYPILGLIGSRRPIDIDIDALSKKLAGFDQKKRGQDPYLTSEKDFLLLHAGDAQALGSIVGEGPFNTDNRPFIEYLAPISHIQKRQLVGTELADVFERLSAGTSALGEYAQAGAYVYRATVAVDRMDYDARTLYLGKASALVQGSRILDRFAMAIKRGASPPASDPLGKD